MINECFKKLHFAKTFAKGIHRKNDNSQTGWGMTCGCLPCKLYFAVLQVQHK